MVLHVYTEPVLQVKINASMKHDKESNHSIKGKSSIINKNVLIILVLMLTQHLLRRKYFESFQLRRHQKTC